MTTTADTGRPTSVDLDNWQDVLASVYGDHDGAAVLVVDGYGVSVNVSGGQLLIRDGIGDHRRERVVSRSDRTVQRIVVLSRSGSVTLGALQWCADVGVSLSVVDPDGVVTATTAQPCHDDARLRRTQAAAYGTPLGDRIASALIVAKIRGHAATLSGYGHATADVLTTHADMIEQSSLALDRLRELEAASAAAYFGALPECVTVRFASHDVSRVPERWLSVQSRKSPLDRSKSPRGAADPLNAILNYAYALGGTITRQSCYAVGLDPTLGVMHTDKLNRNSMALDILEVLRPTIERDVFRLVSVRRFRKVDFVETVKGQCRLNESVTHSVTDNMPHWTAAIAPTIEWVAHELADSSDGRIRRRTPLTQRTRLNARVSDTPKRGVKPPTIPNILPTCRDCGRPLTESRRKLCSSCWVVERERLAVVRAAKGRETRRATMNETGTDPAQTAGARSKRSESLSRERTERDRWDDEHTGETFDRDAFTREVVPLLVAVPLSAIVAGTGVSYSAASRIRRGALAPHPRHWGALTALVDKG